MESKKDPKVLANQEEEEDDSADDATDTPLNPANPDAKKKKKKKKNKKTAAPTHPQTIPAPAPGLAPAEPTAVDTDLPTDAAEADKKKKKKKSRPLPDPDKKKKTGEAADDEGSDEEMGEPDRFPLPYSKKGAKLVRFQDNSAIVNLKNWAEGPTTQTSPPTRTIDEQFPGCQWNTPGVVQEYVKEQAWRNSSEECKKKDLLWEERLGNLRKAAEAHRQVRKYAQTIARPGIKMVDLCQKLESVLKHVINDTGIQGGQAFPTGCSLNHVAAHYTPNYGDDTVLQYNDVCKLDFGTHFGGNLIDSAFTIAFNPRYENLLKASQEATNAGIKVAGIDARLSEIGEAVQETMESFEVELDGKTYKIKSISNLCGHSIDKYHIHAGNTVPNVRGSDPSIKMKEVGKGYIYEDYECSHYMKEYDAPRVPLKNPSAKRLLKTVNDNFGTLAWCRRWIDDLGESNYLIGLRELVSSGIINDYPPLVDVPGSYVAQYEHSLFLKPSGLEILSKGDDY